MTLSSKIILNTSVTYGRSVFAMFVALFSTRWILEALGEVDYGLYGLVGSLIALLAILNAGLSIGVIRFYSFAVGEGEKSTAEETKEILTRWFNAAFSIHLILPILFVSIGWPVGEYIIKNWLVIPDERLNVSLFVFRVSLIPAFLMVFSVPFSSMYIAHQKMTELAIYGVIQTCLILILSWILLKIPGDKLLFYTVGMVLINITFSIVIIIRSVVKFASCRVRIEYLFEREYLKKLFSYSGWKMFGMGCFTLRRQGLPMLINIQFGPSLNAAYMVADKLAEKSTMISQSFNSAIQPAITSVEGKGDRALMLQMALRACKFGTLLMILFAIPLIIEINNVLELWLVDPPQYAGMLCQWLLAMLIVDRLTNGHMIAINAKGKIAACEIIQGLILLSALPIMWILMTVYDDNVVSAGKALFVTIMMNSIARLLFAKKLLGFPILRWIKQVFIPVMAIIALTFFSSKLMAEINTNIILHIILTSLVCGIIILGLSWQILLDTKERYFILGKFKKYRKA